MIAGIIFLGVLPPVGLVLIGLGIAEQTRLNGRRAHAYQAEMARMRRIRQRDLERASKYFQ